jgi:hypothetical protein
VRHRFEPPIGRCRMPSGGARLMLQAAKRTGAAAPNWPSICSPSRNAPGRILVVAIASGLSMMALALVSNSAANSVSNSVSTS